MAPQVDPPELPEGTRLLDRYTIIDRIGSGGMASIYRASDERLDRIVCVKLLRSVIDGSSGSTSGRSVYEATHSHFLQEALMLSRLTHPNTLRIYDFGYLAQTGRPFQISEFLDGGNLEQHVRARGALNAEETSAILERICGAVAEAHQHEVIHRDIKPSNILFGRVGEWLMPKQDVRRFDIAVNHLVLMGFGDGAAYPFQNGAGFFGVEGAVAEAHQHEVIHRDIKPSNILFGRVGEWLMPKLADFGIAHSATKKRAKFGPRTEGATDVVPDGFEDETGEQLSMVTLFSPRWASPEQLAGSAQGPATDIYALGLVTVYMLAGRPIFEGNDIRFTFRERIRGDEFITRLLSAIDMSDLTRRVLVKAMAAIPEQRYQDVSTFHDALRQTLSGARSAQPPAVLPWKTPSEAITMSVELPLPLNQEVQEVAPPERAVDLGGARARVVDVVEKLDLSVPTPSGTDIRFRLTFLPSATQSGFRINIKGLNCFLKSSAGRPTPAIATDVDGTVEFVSTTKATLGEVGWSFGVVQTTPTGFERVFHLDSGDMVIPFSQAPQSVALFLGSRSSSPEESSPREVIILCRRG